MRRVAVAVLVLCTSLLVACGSSDPSFRYGSGVGVLPGSQPTAPGQWASDGRPPGVQFPPPPNEQPVATISIPDIGLSDIPVFDRDLGPNKVMQIAGGYSLTRYARSTFFGGTSNTVIYGHDDIEGGVFGKLTDLHQGSQIHVTLHDGSTLTYVVNRSPTVVAPTFVQLLERTAIPELTLFTCYPLWVDDHRVFVTATPAGGPGT